MTKAKDKVGPRTVALVGTYLSGKTSLFESLLAATGAIVRKGTTGEGTSVGDASREARDHGFSTELNAATTQYMGDEFTFLDCPGSIEFLQETLNVLPVIDAAIVVCDPDADKTVTLKPILKTLSDAAIPHFIFVNKIDKARGQIGDLLPVLQAESERPLVLRQIPILKGEVVTGFIDLALERAFHYRPHAPSQRVDLPGALADAERAARYQMLERLADNDDHLMEELLDDIAPPQEEVIEGLAREFAQALIVPVLIGSAENDNGVRRLLKALRHEVPGINETRRRLGLTAPAAGSAGYAHIIKTLHTPHGGKLSLARVLEGTLNDGDEVIGPEGRSGRIAGIMRLKGAAQDKLPSAGTGELVALGRLDAFRTGDTLTSDKSLRIAIKSEPPLEPVYAFAVTVKDRKDEMKMTAAITKLTEEDPSLRLSHESDPAQILLKGQGEMHLRVALARLKNKYGLALETAPPKVPYREAIRKGATQRGRHKKQSGGHGQFGDIVVEIEPLPRGSGFRFDERISGGVVPRNYFPAIEAGVRDYLAKGPLGFPVVDVAVTLTDGSYHTVDSSDMAFRMAGRLAMAEALPNCAPVLLEPIMATEIFVPSGATAKVNQMVTGRRGHIMGFDARAGWPGWEVVYAHIPQAELHDLIIELRSATAGAGTFRARFEHLQELTGRAAEDVVAGHRSAA